MKKSSIQKLAVAGFIAIVFVLYSLHQRNDSTAAVVAPTKPSTSSADTTTPTTTTYKDGQYTGSAADAYYGYIQVKATIQGGKLTGVAFLQYPNDQRNSVEINQQAMPYLQQEAIQAQSAQVDVVSGATDTSQAFVQSLSSALSQAQS